MGKRNLQQYSDITIHGKCIATYKMTYKKDIKEKMKANIPFPYSNLFLLIIYLCELLRVHKFYSPINISVYLIQVYENMHMEYHNHPRTISA